MSDGIVSPGKPAAGTFRGLWVSVTVLAAVMMTVGRVGSSRWDWLVVPLMLLAIVSPAAWFVTRRIPLGRTAIAIFVGIAGTLASLNLDYALPPLSEERWYYTIPGPLLLALLIVSLSLLVRSPRPNSESVPVTRRRVLAAIGVLYSSGALAAVVWAVSALAENTPDYVGSAVLLYVLMAPAFGLWTAVAFVLLTRLIDSSARSGSLTSAST